MRVLTYTPEGSTWCREGWATEQSNGVFDTYWTTTGSEHRLTEAEIANATFQFDTDDFDELDQYQYGVKDRWATFAETDRRYIPSQHGLALRYFVRKGAQPDLETQIANAQEHLRSMESGLVTARLRVKGAKESLAELIAQRRTSDQSKSAP